jgi:hypothetical protein
MLPLSRGGSMRKLTVTVAIAAGALIFNACQDATEPAPEATQVYLSSPGGGQWLQVASVAGGKRIRTANFSIAGSDFQCVGTVTLGSFDNVVVPQNGFCDISNSMVKGNIKALENSTLFVSGNNRIGGNVEGDKARDVEVFNRGGAPNVILGNIVITETTLETFSCGAVLPNGDIILVKNRGALLGVGGVFCTVFFGLGNTLEKGNIKVEESLNTGSFQVAGNSVAQNLQVFKNRGPAAKLVSANSVGQNLQCFENDPPFVGGPNMAQKAEGQCF